MQTSSFILHDILRRLSETRAKQNKTDLETGGLVLLSISLAAVSFAGLSELAFEFPGSTRTFLVLLFALALVFLTGWFVGRPLMRLVGVLPSTSDQELAGRVGRFFPPVHDRLLNLLQLHREMSGGKSLYSPALLDASFQDLAGLISSVDFRQSVDPSRIATWRRWLYLSAGISIFIAACFPSSLPLALYRLAHFNREFTPPPRYAFEVMPGDEEVTKGESVPVRIRIQALGQSREPRELVLVSQIEDQSAMDQVTLRADSAGIFKTVLQNVRNSTQYFAQTEDVRSPRYKLTVIDRPIIRSFQVRLDYPSYSRLPPRIQDDFVGDVTALAGTRTTITGSSNKELREASIEFGSGEKKSLNVRGGKFSSSFTLMTDGSYHVSLTDVDGLRNPDPIKYQIKVVADEPPTVAIVEPGRNLDIASNQSVDLLIHAKDDFGFTRLRLGYRLIHSRYEQPSQSYQFSPIPLPSSSGTQLEVPFQWSLQKLRLVPEDVVEYFAEVFDNDAVHGPKGARSSMYLIRLPSLDEVFSDMDKGHEQSIDEMKQAMEDAQKLKQDIESINQDLKKNKDFDWQKQKKLEEMAKKYQDVQKKVENVQSKLDQMVQKMDQQKVLSDETLQKYMELQQLFEQLNSAGLQKMLKQMQQSMQNLSKDQLQQALQQLTFSEERFRQSIDRTIQLLKRIQIEQKLDEVKKRAQELEATEQQLKDETAKAGDDRQKQEEIAKRQEDLARAQENLEASAENLQKRMEEFFNEMPADKLQKLNEQLRQQQLGQQMKQASEQARQGRMQQAQQMQDQIQQQLQQYGQQLESLQQEMLQKNAQHVMTEMRRAINNLLELSKRQEELKQESQNAPPNSPQLRQNAQEQMSVIQDLGNVIQGLGDLAQRSFAVTPEMAKSIGEGLAHMNNAMKNLDIRSGGTASSEQTQAMGSLNKAAMQINNALQTMMQGGQGGAAGSLLGQLQMLSGQQMSINQQTLGMQQAADAARLAQEQEAVRKSLEQLNQEAQASGEQKKLLGDLEKITEDMKEVVKNLEQNSVNPETVKKQEKILSRLLDAAKSMRERDYEKKRKAESGIQVARRSPKELDPNSLDGKNRLQEDLLKALEQGYSKDYRELIRKYFEELEKTEKVDNE